jgi:hypothetical protein
MNQEWKIYGNKVKVMKRALGKDKSSQQKKSVNGYQCDHRRNESLLSMGKHVLQYASALTLKQ